MIDRAHTVFRKINCLIQRMNPGRCSLLIVRVIFFILLMNLSLAPSALAQTEFPFSLQQGAKLISGLPAEPKLDTGRPFVIRETYQRALPSALPRQKGIIGLDMLINPNQYPIVKVALKGTPAQRQGILPGDVIVAINGTSAMGKELAEVDAMISDVPGDAVNFSILRGTRLLKIQLTVVSLEQVSQSLQDSYAFLLNQK